MRHNSLNENECVDVKSAKQKAVVDAREEEEEGKIKTDFFLLGTVRRQRKCTHTRARTEILSHTCIHTLHVSANVVWLGHFQNNFDKYFRNVFLRSCNMHSSRNLICNGDNDDCDEDDGGGEKAIYRIVVVVDVAAATFFRSLLAALGFTLICNSENCLNFFRSRVLSSARYSKLFD